jgi:F0F1-type ATP synthase membrane subunit b/b'
MGLRSYVNFPIVLGVLFIIAGIGGLGLTQWQNAAFGVTLGDSTQGKIIAASGSVYMDSFAALLAIAIGATMAWRWIGISILLAFPLAFYALYSVQSSFGYQMTERLAKSERLRDGAKEARTAVEQANASVLTNRASLIEDLNRKYDAANKTAGNRTLSRIERNEAKAEKDRLQQARTLLANAPPQLQQLPPAPEAILADPQAEIIAKWTPLSATAVAAIQISMLSVGFPLGKIIGFMFGSALIQFGAERARQRLAELKREAQAFKTTDIATTVEAVKPNVDKMLEDSVARVIASVKAEAAPVANDDDEPSFNEGEADRSARAVDGLLDQQQRQINDLQSYLVEATDVAPTVSVPASQFLRHYKDWSRLKGREPTIGNVVVLGHLLRAAGLARLDGLSGSGTVHYAGRSLRRLTAADVADEGVGRARAA